MRDIEVIDAYGRQTNMDPNDPSEDQLENNFFGNLYVDGTSFGAQDGDGTSTNGTIVLGGFGDDTILSHLWRVLRTRELHVRVAFGVPLDPARFDRRTLATRARTAIVEALDRLAGSSADPPGHGGNPASG